MLRERRKSFAENFQEESSNSKFRIFCKNVCELEHKYRELKQQEIEQKHLDWHKHLESNDANKIFAHGAKENNKHQSKHTGEDLCRNRFNERMKRLERDMDKIRDNRFSEEWKRSEEKRKKISEERERIEEKIKRSEE